MQWVKAKEYKEIIYEKAEGIAKITINRPERRNSFTVLTMKEMVDALRVAKADKEVAVIVFTGAGDKAFCAGGDIQMEMDVGEGMEFPPADDLFTQIRTSPKVVIAMVNGFAVGGGNVLATNCDLTIASDNAKFMQTGPRVGSFAGGFGTTYLSRIIGEKKAREIWFLCRQYTAQEALDMGLVNKVVPVDKLEEETVAWCKEIMMLSPTMIKNCKWSFNVDTDHIVGIARICLELLVQYYGCDESMELHQAFLEKRKPDISRFR